MQPAISPPKKIHQISVPVTPIIIKTPPSSKTLIQPVHPTFIIKDSLNSISDIMEQEKPQKQFEVFDPVLQSKIEKVRKEKILRQENFPESLKLDVDDKNVEFDGYRETIINGNCWLIPTDTSFDELDSRVVMRDPDCDEKKSTLSNLIKALK